LPLGSDQDLKVRTLPRIVYLGPPEGFHAVSLALDKAAKAEHVDAEASLVASALMQADGLIDASMRVKITGEMLRSAPHLRIISCATTGSDHIARDEAASRGIEIRTLREDPELLRDLTPAAELSWALVMACARRLVPAVAHVKEGNWQREQFPGTMLRGRTLGLVGCGRIGQWMARYATAFGMRVVGHDPIIDPWPSGIERGTLLEVAEQADVLSVHVHLSDATRGLISAEVFERMRAGSIFINTSRGAVADEAALLKALETGRLAAAGLDVLEGEPQIENHPLLRYARANNNLLITPHCGGYSPDAVRLVCRRAAEKVVERLKAP
jgi:phosphoglycerate dehydrogenase-like enzyme